MAKLKETFSKRMTYNAREQATHTYTNCFQRQEWIQRTWQNDNRFDCSIVWVLVDFWSVGFPPGRNCCPALRLAAFKPVIKNDIYNDKSMVKIKGAKLNDWVIGQPAPY